MWPINANIRYLICCCVLKFTLQTFNICTKFIIFNWTVKNQHYKSLSQTYIYFHSFDRKDPDRRWLLRHESVELMPPLVPLDTVQVVAVQVVAAHQVCAVTSLYIAGYPQVNLGEAIQFWKYNVCCLLYKIWMPEKHKRQYCET